ncbi:N-acetylmuramoyl-L-alanine amidase [Streptomyces sp. SL13]|uniref:N-acetylmuramoyl-L-alanine amidase n=1 Tax=Streptantibioticus silvisoli TaxID=2705255 RepID=A0AA90KHB0_9ACTN|nr:N-acetylmuramoyl-L-alanine amidase [Streptantibioticus silvisoli]MDI5971565.1 N-acetylmuramoyl-L-alanine amidase [Streptantibioticus silvisoli]
MHRQPLRKLMTSALAAGALAAGCVALLPATAQARGTAGAEQGTGGVTAEQADFSAASARYHVPVPVLLAVAYQESQWASHTGQYNTSGGFGPMDLTDVTAAMVSGGGTGAAGRAALGTFTADPALHTLTAAAKLSGLPAARLRDDTAGNILGGAALLASYEKALTGGTSADPADWYGAVARYSGSPDRKAAASFADGVFARVRDGARLTTPEGQRVALAADGSVRPATGQLAALRLKADDTTAAECPVDLDCQFLPADPSNYQAANRPTDGMKVRYIVIHDTESSYQSAIDSFQAPGNGDAANYVMRSSDGAVTQMVPDKDVAFQAGNYWFNMHSIGIEHEGFAAHGATWYTRTQYQNTADLVTYLAARYGIPLDRQHIIGHDNVPGPLEGYVAGMHWDPGPYWDWSSFMSLLGAPVDGGPHGVGAVGSAVTITPSLATNEQTVDVCPADDPTGDTTTCTDQTQASNFLYVRTAASATAPLVADPALHPGASAGTDDISDWGDTVSQGQQFVVAGVSGDWTAIWYSGQKVWFYNPGGVNTTPACGVRIVGAAGGAAVSVYGEGYPQPSEYPAGLSPSTEDPLTAYSIPAGQSYVSTAAPVSTDDFFSSSDTLVTGAGQLYTIQYDHRLVLVNASDVSVHTR